MQVDLNSRLSLQFIQYRTEKKLGRCGEVNKTDSQ